jgi:hypothetical protein
VPPPSPPPTPLREHTREELELEATAALGKLRESREQGDTLGAELAESELNGALDALRRILRKPAGKRARRVAAGR